MNFLIIANSLFTDQFIVGIFASLFLLLIGAIVYMVKGWVAIMNARDAKNEQLIVQTMGSLNTLNITLTKVNSNLEEYQATMKTTVATVQEALKDTSQRATKHDEILQEHSIQFAVLADQIKHIVKECDKRSNCERDPK